MIASGICAVGIKSAAAVPEPCKPKKHVSVAKPAKDAFKARYWILSSLFRF